LVIARIDFRQLNQGLLLANSNGDAAFIAKALSGIDRGKGMDQVARDTGLSRESLYKALSGERSPDFDTILKVIGALD
jgi:probable addiction module antidote protein